MSFLPRQIRYYQTSQGKSPFLEWRNKLETTTRIVIDARLSRLETGNLGDTKPIGNGIFELRIMKGPGYRIYYGVEEDSIILLLIAGDKSSQKRDIAKAQVYWTAYKRESI